MFMTVVTSIIQKTNHLIVIIQLKKPQYKFPKWFSNRMLLAGNPFVQESFQILLQKYPTMISSAVV